MARTAQFTADEVRSLTAQRTLTPEEAALLRAITKSPGAYRFSPQELEAAAEPDEVEAHITELCRRNPYM